ncbi:MAG: hypothetical protein FJX47_09425, partial [Alphaproteobacteria bacterium]|nr:hypothetical protein [Alphaproteobacteria bacterium]
MALIPNLLGGSGLVGFDYSALLYANRKVLPGTNAQQQALAQTQQKASSTSGLDSVAKKAMTTAEISNRFFSDKPLIDMNSVEFKKGVEGLKLGDNQKKLRALYQAVQKLGEMANFGASDQVAQTGISLSSLNKQFQKYLGEVKSFLGSTKIEGMTVIDGVKTPSVSASVSNPSVKSYIQSPVLATSNILAVPSWDGTEAFTLAAVNGASTINVSLDMAEAQGLGFGLTLDGFATYANNKLSAAGALARFEAYNIGSTANPQWTLRLNQVEVEAVTLTSDAASDQDAVYVSGTANNGSDTYGFVNKLNVGAAPTTDWSRAANTTKADQIYSSAQDASGNLYVVGSTAGNADGEVNNSGANDVFITKYDGAGRVVWQKLLGSTEDAKGFAVAADSNGNVVVAGQTAGNLTTSSFGGSGDSFVTMFDSSGQEKWTRQVAPVAQDAALGLTIDSSNNIFVTGFSDSAVSATTTSVGGRDAYVSKLDSSGNKVWDKQFGSTGTDTASSVAVDNAGNVFVAANVNGNAVVTKYADDPNSTATWQVDLGSLGGGDVGQIKVDAGKVYLVGTSSNGALSGTIVNPLSGGSDAFVSRLTDSGASASVDFTTYVGSSGTDSASALSINSATGDIYIAGAAGGSVSGQTYSGNTDGFVTKIDSSGTQVWTNQWASGTSIRPTSIQFQTDGSQSLNRLGFAEGLQSPLSAGSVVRETSARAGQFFYVQVDDGAKRKITIENGDSF